MHRPAVGLVALVLLVAGAALLVFPQAGNSGQNLAAGCLRVGAILGVLWLALPDVARPASRWVLLAVLALIILVAWRPKLIILALVLLVAVAILRPRLSGAAPRRP